MSNAQDHSSVVPSAEALCTSRVPEPACEPSSVASLTDHERRVLGELAGVRDVAIYFRTIERHTGLTRAEVRTACRSLTDKGLAEYWCGLFTEDGEVAGSGYAATDKGARLYWNTWNEPLPTEDGSQAHLPAHGEVQAEGRNDRTQQVRP